MTEQTAREIAAKVVRLITGFDEPKWIDLVEPVIVDALAASGAEGSATEREAFDAGFRAGLREGKPGESQ